MNKEKGDMTVDFFHESYPGPYLVKFEELFPCPEVTFIDVRAPVEFAAGHIPGAVNIPLFADEERAEIGTVYRQVDKDQALALGEKIARPKVDGIIDQIRGLLPAELVIYCWRGGRRSSEITRLVNEAGIPARRLYGGYKAYRRGIREFVERPRRLLILGGKTGSGKTAILLGLKKLGMQVIDLEGLASHKGSVFGHINENEQPTTEQFENNFFDELQSMDPDVPLLLENESHIIGTVHLPPPLLFQMRAAPLLLVEVPVGARIRRLVTEYTDTDRDELIMACGRIAKKLTKPRLDEVTGLLEQGDFAGACSILLGYYDHYYNRGIEKRKNQDISEIRLDGTDLERDIARVMEALKHGRR